MPAEIILSKFLCMASVGFTHLCRCCSTLYYNMRVVDCVSWLLQRAKNEILKKFQEREQDNECTGNNSNKRLGDLDVEILNGNSFVQAVFSKL